MGGGGGSGGEERVANNKLVNRAQRNTGTPLV